MSIVRCCAYTEVTLMVLKTTFIGKTGKELVNWCSVHLAHWIWANNSKEEKV